LDERSAKLSLKLLPFVVLLIVGVALLLYVLHAQDEGRAVYVPLGILGILSVPIAVAGIILVATCRKALRLSEIISYVLCGVAAVIGSLCIYGSLDDRSFFTSALTFFGIVLLGLAGLGVYLLWRIRISPERARFSMWISAGFAAILALLLYVLYYVLTLGYGTA